MVCFHVQEEDVLLEKEFDFLEKWANDRNRFFEEHREREGLPLSWKPSMDMRMAWSHAHGIRQDLRRNKMLMSDSDAYDFYKCFIFQQQPPSEKYAEYMGKYVSKDTIFLTLAYSELMLFLTRR